MHSGSKKGRSAEVDDSYLAMAYHWKQAGFLGKSMQYYEHLGAFSAMQGSDKEALESFHAAIEMVAQCKEEKRPPVEHEHLGGGVLEKFTTNVATWRVEPKPSTIR